MKTRNIIIQLILSTLLLFTIFGCAGIKIQKIKEQVAAVKEDCESKFKSGILANYSERAECLNAGFMKVYSDINYPYLDLIHLINAYRMAIAERIDRGELSFNEGELIMANVRVLITQEELRRNTDRAYAAAAAAQGMGAMLGGMGALNQSLQPLTRKPINCIRSGNMIQCY
uniref:Lipoprotein n=1 Tax=candidate division WOR-3 bacterium TaxID=2052148 RepID=A0A7V3KMI8_UNCW3